MVEPPERYRLQLESRSVLSVLKAKILTLLNTKAKHLLTMFQIHRTNKMHSSFPIFKT